MVFTATPLFMSLCLLIRTWHLGRTWSSPLPTDQETHKEMWGIFLKLVIPLLFLGLEPILFPNNRKPVSLSMLQVGGDVQTMSGCTVSWKCGPMGHFYVTLSNCHFHFGGMYITQRDIHFLSCPLPFKEHCNADGEGIWQFPARLRWSNSHARNCLLFGARCREADELLGILWRISEV